LCTGTRKLKEEEVHQPDHIPVKQEP
jgi:hypothetical protein